jgi:hypothetical protein
MSSSAFVALTPQVSAWTIPPPSHALTIDLEPARKHIEPTRERVRAHRPAAVAEQ